ncbi:MAG: NAD(P)H-binding protein [Gemmatimonadetes bacterium]|nr:NAD(P)H-binding protein [Gemmatimonadota bacterium]
MRLAVFGGTGRVGSRVIASALAAGHAVHALARDPARLPPRPGLSCVTGDATDPVAVRATLEGAEAVISALGGGPVERPGTVLSVGMRQIVAAMAHVGLTRVVAVAGSGILDHPAGGLRGEAPDFPAIFRAINAEHLGTWRAVRQSELAWTLACCPDLVDGEGGGRYRVTADQLPEGATRIAVGDVAGFLLTQVEHLTFVRRRVGLGD